MEYSLVRSKRKTLAVCVGEDGAVTVKAPLQLSLREIERVLAQKEQWVLSTRDKIRRRAADRLPFDVSDGAMLLLLGKPLYVGSTDLGQPLRNGDILLLPRGGTPERKAAAIQWYKQFAQRVLADRVQLYAGMMGLEPAKITVGSAKGRWGSCSAAGSIRFSYRLITAPPEAVDYVVVHELAHLRQMNHSAAFYEVVRRVLPDYRERAALLKGGRYRVDFEN